MGNMGNFKKSFYAAKLMLLFNSQKLLSLVLIRQIKTLVFVLKSPLPMKSKVHKSGLKKNCYRPQHVKLGNTYILEVEI